MKRADQIVIKVILWVYCSIFGTLLIGQVQLQVHPVDTSKVFLSDLIIKNQYADSLTAFNASKKLIEQLQSQNYLLASIDSFWLENGVANASIFVGKQFGWIHLKTENIPESLRSKVGFRTNNFEKSPFNLLKINELKEKMLVEFENNGSPFAQIFIDKIQVENGQVSGVLKAETGPQIFFNKLDDFGEVEISKRYLEKYLGIEENQPFDRSKVLNIRNRIRELPFLKEAESAKINFLFDRAEVKLDLTPVNASRFDFVIGVLPNNQELGRLLITGHFLGEFQNQFGKGERIFAEVRQLRPQSPQLDLAYEHPYIFDLPFGLNGRFHLHKRDTTFLDVDFELGAKYLLEGGSFFKTFFNQNNSRLLSVDADKLLITRQLPSQVDVVRTSLGVEWQFQKLDYRFNPRMGWESQLVTTFGLKAIKKNSQILDLSNSDFDFETAYDSLQLNSFQGSITAEISKYFPTFSNQTLKIGVTGQYIFSNQAIFKNEQKRIGGNQLLRGFDEEAIFATNYAVTTFEYRLLTGEKSCLFSFFDLGYVENKTTQNNTTDFPLGFGAGVTFDTSVGVFGLSYALGRQLGNPVDFSAGKIHFGFLSLF